MYHKNHPTRPLNPDKSLDQEGIYGTQDQIIYVVALKNQSENKKAQMLLHPKEDKDDGQDDKNDPKQKKACNSLNCKPL